MASNWYRLMRTVGRSSDIVNRNGLPRPRYRLEGVPVVTPLGMEPQCVSVMNETG